MSTITNPYSRARTYLHPQSQFYGSRGSVEAFLEGMSRPNLPDSYAVVGLPGMGKTSLLLYLADPKGPLVGSLSEHAAILGPQFRDGMYRFWPVYVPFRLMSPDDYWLRHMYEHVYNETRSIREEKLERNDFPEPRECTGGDDIRYELERLSKYLKEDGAIRLVLLLDDFHVPFREMSATEATRLRPIRGHASFVLATTDVLENVNSEAAGSPFFYNMKEEFLSGLDRQNALSLVQEPIEQEGTIPAEDQELLLTHSGRHPSLLFRACESLWNMRQRLRLSDQRPLPDNHREGFLGLLAEEYQQPFEDYWKSLPREEQLVLEKMALSPREVTAEESKLENLTDKGVVAFDLETESYVFFSPLFAGFVRRLAKPKEAPQEEAITASLTKLESQLYEYLKAHAGQVCTFEQLHRDVWDRPFGDTLEERDRAKSRVQVTISRLRSKLEEMQTEGVQIVNVRDRGYRLISPDPTMSHDVV